MKFIFSYCKKYAKIITVSIIVRLIVTLLELIIPYIMEHLIDNVAPLHSIPKILLWGGIMTAVSAVAMVLHFISNRCSIKSSAEATYDIRKDLFNHAINLSGNQTDEFGLPSLTSRMTSDSYNVQNFIRSFQMMGVRSPIQLIGGIIITMTMDPALSSILCIASPILIVVVVFISIKGIPLYDRVQRSVDDIVRVMRENITGIRVVKALSKEEYETRRFADVNEEMTRNERRAGIIMSLPGPVMQLVLNTGLAVVVLVGATRVNNGQTQPGVILAFLTYFNMILQGVMGLNRLFMMTSKANASANRIATVVAKEEELFPIPEEEAAHTDSSDFIVFDNVSFRYGKDDEDTNTADFAGEGRQMALSNINFTMKKGSSLGIIGPTGCGKTTIINLLMRFYDATEGAVFVNGKDVRTYDKDELHRMFGVVFQNDTIFADTIAANIDFGRDVTDEQMKQAVADACAAEFVEAYKDTYQHKAAIHGANFSGGQRQRLLVSRAFAADPDILVLDDSSSALDYKTDAALRKAVREHHSGTTTITIAQRVSSIMGMDQILVIDDGRIIGKGTHEELMKSCKDYIDIYNTQMGEEG